MAASDPRTTIYNGVVANLDTITKDDDATAASVLHIWENQYEDAKTLFFSDDYDVVFSYGDPQSRGVRRVDEIPVHYLMTYPVTVTTVDKPVLGLGGLDCTASRMQYKATYALRDAVTDFRESAAGASPAYRLTLISDDSDNRLIGGLRFWETLHRLEYETDYG